ncbi:MAG: hypothetical protein COU06_02150 [Candidatus Harrisonbacteria bacterium CG10_big_fil_rev_8_21_14_0_10_38_8]|uniref:Small ribosomal subunit protein bS6 n=1 Tax=Candidatus Harrisonbacteria bacterium CG10_big_fil_rev_8_21_14_0_10_38_8 TaxID=1974582 RepID=A0A2M6WJU7_9BACT|nr:MAG: hypothetical protein COU06_02150 [Candidatus Harrisonbacteria bacterium CG10_big_fil_rev_8_21_14_0_10_38_8]
MEIQTQKTYELGYLIKLGEDPKLVSDFLTKHGAKIVLESKPANIELAYQIKKEKTAQFGYIHFTLEDNEAIERMSKELNLDNLLLRYLFIALPVEKLGDRKTEKKARKQEAVTKSSDRLENLTNEKLEQTLEEILK